MRREEYPGAVRDWDRRIPLKCRLLTVSKPSEGNSGCSRLLVGRFHPAFGDR